MTYLPPTIKDLRELAVALRCEDLELAAFAHGMTPRTYAEARRKALAALSETDAAPRGASNDAPRRPRKPRIAAPGDLLAPAQAADKLGISIKTLNAHVAARELRCVIVGRGKKRLHR